MQTKMLYIMCAITLLTFTQIRPAEAALISGDELLAACSSGEDKDQLLCQGYIAGLIDYHNLVRSLGTAPSVNFCVPEGTSMGKVAEVVRFYLSENPTNGPFIASPAVALALYQVWPCKK